MADKRIRMDDSAAKKKKNKKEKPSSDESEWELPIFEDRVAYANLLGGCVGPLLPPPDTLLESRKFAETVSHFFQVRAFFFLLLVCRLGSDPIKFAFAYSSGRRVD